MAHVWSTGGSGIIDSDDLLALAAVAYVYIKLRLTAAKVPAQLPRTASRAIAALFVRRQADDVHSGSAVQRVVHAEFRMLQQLGYELRTTTPMARVGIFRQRFALRQRQLQGDSIQQLQTAARADSVAFLVNQIAPTHLGVAALFVSVPRWCRLGCLAWRLLLSTFSPIAVSLLCPPCTIRVCTSNTSSIRSIICGLMLCLKEKVASQFFARPDGHFCFFIAHKSWRC